MSFAGAAPGFDSRQPWRLVSGSVPGCLIGTVVTLSTRGYLFDVTRPWAGIAATLDLRNASVTLSPDGRQCVVHASSGDVVFTKDDGIHVQLPGAVFQPTAPRPLPSELGAPNRLRYLEGSWVSAGYRSARVRARWLQAFFVLMTLACFGLLLIAVQSFAVATRAVGGSLPTASDTAARAAVARSATSVFGLCILALIIAFFAWSSRTVDNVPALGGGTPKESPRSSVGWWFVPIVDFWKPYTIIREVWDRISVPSRPGGGLIVEAWWLTLIVGFLVDKVAAALETNAPSWSTLQVARGIELVSVVSYLAAAVLGFMMIREIQARADFRANALGLDARPRTLPFEPGATGVPTWPSVPTPVVAVAGAQTAVAPAPPEMGESLRRLSELHDQALVTDDEFAAKRAEILGRL